jgi:manganese/zinc/iron transport system permease protein
VLACGALVGAAVGASGALLATAWEVPTGPVIVLVGFVVVVATLLLAPGRGVLWRARRLAGERRRRRAEAALLDLEIAMHAGPPPTETELALAGGRPPGQLRRALRDLERAGMLERGEGRLVLSETGAAAAHALIERRRLWSAWLEHGWRLQIPDAREPDPSDLRGSLGDRLAGELDRLAAEGAKP